MMNIFVSSRIVANRVWLLSTLNEASGTEEVSFKLCLLLIKFKQSHVISD